MLFLLLFVQSAYALTVSSVIPMNVTPTSAEIVFATDVPSNTKVAYGLTAPFSVSYYSSTLVTQHSAPLQNLTPATTYSYQVSTKDASGAYVAMPIATFTTPSLDFNLYLSPTGDDANSGLTPTEPVLTLKRAHDIISVAAPSKNTVINIASGTYKNQRVVWTYASPAYSISFKGASPQPVFDGCAGTVTCAGGTFFILNNAKGQSTNLKFSNIAVTNYLMGISLNGRWDLEPAFNSDNLIENCSFSRIGNFINSTLPAGYAAVRLYNSRNNTVRNNTFTDIVNLGDYDGYMHAVYAASWAEHNFIVNNTFTRVSGDAVRVRASSNSTYIGGNTFIRAGKYAAASDWYDVNLECPSWNSVFTNNTYGLNFSGNKMNTYVVSASYSAIPCSKPTSDSVRYILNSNVLSY